MSAIQLDNGCLKVSGILDFESVVSIWQNSLPLMASCSALQFDFSGITFTKSAGLALIIEWKKWAHLHNKSIVFNHVPAQLISIAEVSGVDLSSSSLRA